MAARHLQKLRGQDVLQPDVQAVDASESEEETAAPLNPFDLLDDNEVRSLPDAHSASRTAAHGHLFAFRSTAAWMMTPRLQKMVPQQSNQSSPGLRGRQTQQRRKRKPDKSRKKPPVHLLAQASQ